MSNLARTKQNAPCRSCLLVRQHVQKLIAAEIFNRRTRSRMPQHTLRREHNQWLAPFPQCLPSYQVEILGRIRRLANLEVIAGGKLQESCNPSARMFRSLTFKTVRQ